jgi:hypothetical protein
MDSDITVDKDKTRDAKPRVLRMPFNRIKDDSNNSLFCYRKLTEVVEMSAGVRVSNFNMEDSHGKNVCVYWGGMDDERGIDDLTRLWSNEECVELVVTGLHDHDHSIKPVKPSAAKGISAVIKAEPRREDIIHLVDDFKDHITDTFTPPFAKDGEGSKGSYWTYIIGGQPTKSQYFAMDAIYLDLKYECKEPGVVRLHVPRKVFNAFRAATNLPMEIDGLESTGYLQEIDATVNVDNPPTFVRVERDEKDGGSFCTRSEGSLTDMMESGHHKLIFKITGFFTMSPGRKSHIFGHVFHLTLVGLRAFSSLDDIQRIERVNNATAFA